MVLSRKTNESIMIGDVEVFIVDVQGDRVRVGIEAPKDVPVHRREIYDAIQRDGAKKILDTKEKEECRANSL